MKSGPPQTDLKRSFPWGSVGLALSSIVVTLLVLEVILRTTHLFGARLSVSTPDPLLGWRFAPGSVYWESRENDHPITGTINSWGWRDREWTLAKPPGTVRIAVLGDSYVEAMQVESDSTFLRIAERIINEKHPVITEWMNFGRSSCTQTEEWLILQHDVVQFAPDIVVVVFFPVNDIDDVSRELTDELRPFFVLSSDGTLALDTEFARTGEYRMRKLIDPLKKNSALISLLMERYRLLKFMAKVSYGTNADGGSRPLKAIRGGFSLCTSEPDSAALRAYRLNKALLRTMAEFCRLRSIYFMLVSTELPTFKPDVEHRVLAQDATFNSTFFDDDLQSFADSLGVPFCGLHRPARELFLSTGASLNWPTDIMGGHWNYFGHRFVADQLMQGIVPVLGFSNDPPDNSRTKGKR